MSFSKVIISMLVIAIAIAGIFYFVLSPDNANGELIKSRPAYKSIEKTVFKDLPEYPSNFAIIKRDVYSGQIKELDKVFQAVYKQPEFYPTWERNGLNWFTNHDYSRWGVHGYGLFPSEISYTVSNMTADDEINVYSFLHTSWGIETWQGLKLVPVYNNVFFDVEVNPGEVLLEPTFPKFYRNWTRIIQYKITAKQDVPKGNYLFSLTFTSPSSDTNNRWTWEALNKYTDNQYHDEIQKCIDNTNENGRCNTLIELRRNKYITGATFVPSNQYKVIITVT